MIALRLGRLCIGAVIVAGAACGSPVPASAPLSASLPSQAPSRPSSSRAVESGEESENKEIEKPDGGASDTGNDDDDSTSNGAAESPISGVECAPPSGSAPDCTRLPRGSSTCMGQTLARRVCETVAPSLDPRVAGLWMTCMRERVDKSRECETSRIFDCGLKAIESACVDGSQRKTCAAIAKSCSEFAPEITAIVCEHALGAWRPEKRPGLLECLHHGCEIGDFGACLP